MEKLYAKDYRVKAHETTKPFANKLAVIYLLYVVLMAVVNIGNATSKDGANGVRLPSTLTYISSVASIVLTGAFTLSLIFIAKQVRSNFEPEVKDLFEGFKHFGPSIVLNLLISIFVGLWCLLLVIPGIIMAYAYSMAFYIYDENPNMSAMEAIKASKELMKGHKWELFCLHFSYIGWYILCALTCGILSLWVLPRVQQAQYEFYLHITGKDVVVAQSEAVDAE